MSDPRPTRAQVRRLLAACKAALPVVTAVCHEDVWPAADEARRLLCQAIAQIEPPIAAPADCIDETDEVTLTESDVIPVPNP